MRTRSDSFVWLRPQWFLLLILLVMCTNQWRPGNAKGVHIVLSSCNELLNYSFPRKVTSIKIEVCDYWTRELASKLRPLKLTSLSIFNINRIENYSLVKLRSRHFRRSVKKLHISFSRSVSLISIRDCFTWISLFNELTIEMHFPVSTTEIARDFADRGLPLKCLKKLTLICNFLSRSSDSNDGLLSIEDEKKLHLLEDFRKGIFPNLHTLILGSIHDPESLLVTSLSNKPAFRRRVKERASSFTKSIFKPFKFCFAPRFEMESTESSEDKLPTGDKEAEEVTTSEESKTPTEPQEMPKEMASPPPVPKTEGHSSRQPLMMGAAVFILCVSLFHMIYL